MVVTQELNYRELSENETMLAGIISSQGKDIKEINKDMSIVKDHLDDLDQRLEQALQMLTTLTTTLPQKNAEWQSCLEARSF